MNGIPGQRRPRRSDHWWRRSTRCCPRISPMIHLGVTCRSGNTSPRPCRASGGSAGWPRTTAFPRARARSSRTSASCSSATSACSKCWSSRALRRRGLGRQLVAVAARRAYLEGFSTIGVEAIGGTPAIAVLRVTRLRARVHGDPQRPRPCPGWTGRRCARWPAASRPATGSSTTRAARPSAAGGVRAGQARGAGRRRRPRPRAPLVRPAAAARLPADAAQARV